MFVVGLTGGIGSGKTTVAELFFKKGINIIDADKIAHQLTQPGEASLQKIITHFGQTLLNPDHSLNRQKLKKIIFNFPDKKKWLENLLHPLIRLEIKKQIDQAVSPYCIAVIPLLIETIETIETNKNPLINRILVVDIPETIQLQRVQQRDQSSIDDIEEILNTQVSRAERLSYADDIIDNKSSKEELITQVDQLHQLYLSLASVQ